MLSMPIIVALLWGLYYAITEYGLDIINIPTLYMVGGIVSFGLSFFVSKSTNTPINLDFMKSYQGIALVALIVCISSFADLGSLFAMKNVSASYAAIGECIYPVFVPIFAYLIFQKMDFTPVQVLGGVVIMLGVGLVVYGQMFAGDEANEMASDGAELAMAMARA